MKKMVRKLAKRMGCLAVHTRMVLQNKKGESSIGTAVAILTAVVLGGLMLAGLYALLGDEVIPSLAQKIKEMFNYAGK